MIGAAMIGTTRRKSKILAPRWRQFFLNRSNEVGEYVAAYGAGDFILGNYLQRGRSYGAGDGKGKSNG